MNATIQAFRRGDIISWSGLIANIRPGWQLCNGANGTPDLRDKFIVGATQDSGGVVKTNVTGALLQTGGTISHDHSLMGTDELSMGADEGTTTNIKQHIPPFYALAYIMKL